MCGLAVGCERFLGAALDRCTWALRKIAAARLEDMSSKPCSGATARAATDRACVESKRKLVQERYWMAFASMCTSMPSTPLCEWLTVG